MWKASHTETVTAPAAAIWQKWADVSKWPEQDTSLISASIDGQFEVGSTITLKPKGSPTVKVVLTDVKPNETFTSLGKLPLAKLKFNHQLRTSGQQSTAFTQSVSIAGPLSRLYVAMMGKKMEQNLKARMTKMTVLLQKS